MLFVGGPNTRKTNSRWRTAAIFEKIENRPYLCNGSTDRHKIWHVDDTLALQTGRTVKRSTFRNPRWQMAAILKNRKTVIFLQLFTQSTQNLAR